MQIEIKAGFCDAFRPTKVRRVKSFSRAGRALRRILNEESQQIISAYLDEQKQKGEPVEQERQKRVAR